MYSVLGNHKTMTHRYTVNVIHVYNRIIVHTQHNPCMIRKDINDDNFTVIKTINK